MNPIIFTFPRSGSFYLQDHFKQATGYFMEKTHSFDDLSNRFIISVIRNPNDTFQSIYAMQRHYFNNTANCIDPEAYSNAYNYISENANIIIQYEDLILKTDSVIELISNAVGINTFPYRYVSSLVDMPEFNHLVSSKVSKHYGKADLDTIDISKCHEAYSKAASKSIIF